MERHPLSERETNQGRAGGHRRVMQWPGTPRGWVQGLEHVTALRGKHGPSISGLSAVRRNAQNWAELGILHKIMVAERRHVITHTRAILLMLMVAAAAQHEAQHGRRRRPLLIKLLNRGSLGVTLGALEQEHSDGLLSLEELERRITQIAPRHWRGWGHLVSSRAWEEHDQAAGQVSALSAHLSTRELQEIVHGSGGALPLPDISTRARALSGTQLARLWPALEAGLQSRAPTTARQAILN